MGTVTDAVSLDIGSTVLVAVIVAVPEPTPVTRPDGLTVATRASSLAQVTDCTVPAGSATAENCAVSDTAMVGVVGQTVRLVMVVAVRVIVGATLAKVQFKDTCTRSRLPALGNPPSNSTNGFQSTRPPNYILRCRSFNPHAREGRDTKLLIIPILIPKFQSTRPRGARLHQPSVQARL